MTVIIHLQAVFCESLSRCALNMTVWALCFSGQACSTPTGTQLSISANRWVTGNTWLRFLNKASFSCVVQTCTLTWKKGTHVFTRVHRPRYWQLSLNAPPTPPPTPILGTEEWEGPDWCADLNLEVCAVAGRGRSGQPCSTGLLSICDMTWSAGEDLKQSHPAGSGGDSG